jgi:prevent-host-death family protein
MATKKYQISIRTLKDQISRVIRGVREDGSEYVVTYHGKPVAVLRPFRRADTALLRPSRIETELDALRELSLDIQAGWVSNRTAVELVEDQRR